jgi:hypothetical protein
LNLSLKTWNFKYPLYIKKEYGGELKLIPFFLMALFLIHSTSTALFGYSVYVKAYGNMLWIVIVISLINKILNEYYEESVN